MTMTATNEEKEDYPCADKPCSEPETKIQSVSGSRRRFPVVDRLWLDKLVQKHHPHATRPYSVVAPMVDQSDLPFRLLCRRYGAQICFTPMVHARMFCTSLEYRNKFSLLADVASADRPLIAQICGSNPQHVVETALALQPYCDGIDLNCGCPQYIAKRGGYGAFLLEQTEVLLSVVQALVDHLDIPVSVKVRLLPALTREESLHKSLALYRQLVHAGIGMLTIHGRTRHQKGRDTGRADWDAMAHVVQELGHQIPIIANGSIANLSDVMACYQATQVDAVMSSEAILEWPQLFSSRTTTERVGRLQLCREYLELAHHYPPHIGGQGDGFKCIKTHLHRFLHADLQHHDDIRELLTDARSEDDLEHIVNAVERQHVKDNHCIADETLSWYMRHRSNAERYEREKTVATIDWGDDDAADCFACLFDDDY